MRRFVRPRLEMVSLLVLAAGVATLSGVRADDEVQGEDAQTVTASVSGTVTGKGNEADDLAVAAVHHKDFLFIAANTEAGLIDDSVGGVDFLVKGFDADLEAEASTQAQFGGSGDDTVKAIIGDDFDIVVVGSTSSDDGDDHLFGLDTPTGGLDWFIALLDYDDLETVDAAYVNGTTFEDQEATAVAIASDGDYIVAGWTWGDYFGENAGSSSNSEDEIGYDWWVLKISSNLDSNGGDFKWAHQFGTIAYDEPTGIVVDDDGFIYVTGTTTDNNNVVSSGDEEDVPSSWVYCLNPDDGEVEWSTTTELGTLTDETVASGVIMSADSTEVYVAGHTSGIIEGFDGDSFGEAELFVAGLDRDSGDINWVYQSEENATAFGFAGVVLAEDDSPIIGGIAFGNQFNLSFTYWEPGSGDMVAAKIDISGTTPEVSKYFVAAAASNLTEERAFAMVKDPDVEDGVFLIGQQDGDFDEDEEPETDGSVNYLVLKVELEELPEEEEEDSGPDYPYWPIGVGIVVVGGLLFVGAYKWAEVSQARKAKMMTMV